MLHDSFMHIKEYRLQSNRMFKSSYKAFKTALDCLVWILIFHHFADVNTLTRKDGAEIRVLFLFLSDTNR
jgi:hypothetical protein